MDSRPVGFLQTKGLVKTSLILSYPLISIIYMYMSIIYMYMPIIYIYIYIHVDLLYISIVLYIYIFPPQWEMEI